MMIVYGREPDGTGHRRLCTHCGRGEHPALGEVTLQETATGCYESLHYLCLVDIEDQMARDAELEQGGHDPDLRDDLRSEA